MNDEIDDDFLPVDGSSPGLPDLAVPQENANGLSGFLVVAHDGVSHPDGTVAFRQSSLIFREGRLVETRKADPVFFKDAGRLSLG